MRIYGKDLRNDILLIAEIGVNHEGDVNAARNLLRLAAEAGADVVKFQAYTPERFIAANDPVRLARVTRFSLSEETLRQLHADADRYNVGFLSTPVTEDLIPLHDELCPALKIASGDLTFEPALRAAARTGKPILLSTGLGTVEEVDQAVAWIADEIAPAALVDRLLLLHCVTSYPTPVEQANLRSIPFLAQRYGVLSGYSNHVPSLDVCIGAVALGAAVLEVHFTDRKEGRDFHDHALSFNPDDFVELKSRTAAVRAALGRYGKTRQACEEPALFAARKGVVAVRDLPAGHILTAQDLMYARPSSQVPSGMAHTLIGCSLKTSLQRGELIPGDLLKKQWNINGG